MTYLAVFLGVFFVGLLLCAAIDWLLGLRYSDDMTALPSSRFVVIQGGNTYSCDTEAEAVAMAQNYHGVTRIERRSK